MSLILTAETSAVVVPPGSYNMTLTQIERVTGKFGGALRWYWQGFHADHGTFELTAMSTDKLTPSTKPGRWYHTITGVVIKAEAPYDLSQLIGCVCLVLVDNKVAEGGVTYSNVTDVVKLVDDSNSFLPNKRNTGAAVDIAGDIPFTDSNAS